MSRRSTVLVAYRSTLAGLALAALAYELARGLGEAHWSTANFFSYFTVLSNLFAAGVFLASARAVVTGRASARLQSLRGGAVMYMLTTGIVYAVLLSGKHDAIPWTNDVLHRAMPIAVAVDWLVDPPPLLPEARRAVLAWMAFPLLYVVYTLIRGPLAHWYPYFFLNPDHTAGYLGVLAGCVAIAVGQIAMSLAILALGRRGAARGRAEAPAPAVGRG